jgi:hypothetical protein
MRRSSQSGKQATQAAPSNIPAHKAGSNKGRVPSLLVARKSDLAARAMASAPPSRMALTSVYADFSLNAIENSRLIAKLLDFPPDINKGGRNLS